MKRTFEEPEVRKILINLRESIASLSADGTYALPLLASMCLIVTGLSVKSGLFREETDYGLMADVKGVEGPAVYGYPHRKLSTISSASL